MSNQRSLSWIVLPPTWVMRAARKRLLKTNSWEDYYSILTAFYGVPSLSARVNPRIKHTVIAEYRSWSNCVESREDSMSEHTALHELFHHLVFSKNCKPKDEEAEQALADSFADALEQGEPLRNF